jgi:hypothetical protein
MSLKLIFEEKFNKFNELMDKFENKLITSQDEVIQGATEMMGKEPPTENVGTIIRRMQGSDGSDDSEIIDFFNKELNNDEKYIVFEFMRSIIRFDIITNSTYDQEKKQKWFDIVKAEYEKIIE